MMQQTDFPNPYILMLVVPESDIDVMGHANNVAYLRWLEKVAWAHSQALGLDWQAYEANDCALVARHTELDYLQACFAGERLQLCTWISENDGRISITRRYQVIREHDGQTVLRGMTRWVAVSVKTGKLRRMPPHYVEAYKVTVNP